MTEHAKLSASGSTIWLNCSGSVEAQSRIKHERSNDYADLGTLAHHLASLCLKENKEAKEFLNKKISCESDGRKLEIIVDDEMSGFVQEYLDYVLSFEGKLILSYTEERVDFSHLVPEGFGTADRITIDFNNKICHVFDLKYGEGVQVYPENNTQLQLYAIGILHELEFLNSIDSFELHIVQPRKYYIGSWRISKNDLIEFGEYVKKQAEKALRPGASLTPGYKQCQWCSASKGSVKDGIPPCKALLHHTEQIILNKFEESENLKEPRDLSEDEIKLILDNKDLITDYLTLVKDYTYDRLMEGHLQKGYKLVEGKSNRKWADTAEEKLIEKLGEEAFEKKLIGITKAEKKLSKKEVNDLSIKPKGKPTLAKETDKKKALVITPIVDYF